MTLADRLKEAMADKGLTQSSLAKKAGMAQSMIWKLLSGTATKTGRIIDLAQALGVRPEWLSDGSGNKLHDEDDMAGQYNRYVSVKIYEQEQATRDTFMVPALSEQKAAFDTCRAYRITQNTGCADVPAGALIVVDTQGEIGNDDLVYARIGEQYSVYCYKQGGGGGYLSVDDPRVPLIPVSPDIDIVGVIVCLFRGMKRKQ
ncbi:helix-turn-helix domain-containing protein [Xenorhabdus sp. XENO-1]|uniref:helix-turn-helix domain-containing protein n=1 Tax=Xenorhabdus bovienii TaxID=40576 RepID=UPI0020CA6683|nr:helix-turn-helix domain-containing protein [Xenorhabdus bovienii]MCP9266833.1 helix-turn-helix domain-containing protein [Xenorhabdus bovienii subsp. africana]